MHVLYFVQFGSTKCLQNNAESFMILLDRSDVELLLKLNCHILVQLLCYYLVYYLQVFLSIF